MKMVENETFSIRLVAHPDPTETDTNQFFILNPILSLKSN